MRAGELIGRVGGLAVALGIGAAVVSGDATAWAEPSDSTSSSADASSPSDGATAAEPEAPESTTSVAVGSEAAASSLPSAADDDETPPTSTITAQTNTSRRDESTRDGSSRALPDLSDTDSDERPDRAIATVAAPPRAASTPDTAPAVSRDTLQAADVAHRAPSSANTPLAAPAPRVATPAPALSTDPVRFVTSYVSGLVSGVVNVLLGPIAAAGGLPPPAGPPTLWTLLAYARREFFNESPQIEYVPANTSQTTSGQVVGNVGASDADGDALTYTVVVNPRYGGQVRIDQATGNFVYTPTSAMAAVGGTDQFTVVVSDQGAGLHLHGPLGLLEFVPLASPIITVLSALPVVGSIVSTVVASLQHLPLIGDILQPFGRHAVAQTITVTVAPVPGRDLSFPADFRWGVATSAFQGEMGGGAPNSVNSDVWKFLHDPINRLLGAAPGLPENGPGSYLLFDTDARLAAEELGVDTFRTGIEWSRIFPTSTASVSISDEEGVVSATDLQALDALAEPTEVAHYRAVFASLLARRLDPMVTINHYSLPSWVQDPTTIGGGRLPLQAGLPGSATGWLDPSTVAEFRKYSAYLAWKYGDQVDTWLVLNEPGVYPLGGLLYLPGGPVPAFPPGVFRPDLISTFLVNEANAYVGASKEIRRLDAGAQVGFANSMTVFRPANPLNPLDVRAAASFNDFYNTWFPDAVIRGEVDANLDGVITADEIHPDMAGSADFLGVNYYQTGTISGLGVPFLPGLPAATGIPTRSFAPGRCPTAECSDSGQPVDPGGLREVLDIAAGYQVPLWITENGIADADDSRRASYILSHLAVVQDMVADGTDVRGYLYWTLVDNLEWSSGYGPKFGLYSYDPATLVRTARPSVSVVRQITAANALPPDLLAA